MARTPLNPVLLEVVRGESVEAFHRGAWCLIDGDQAVDGEGEFGASYFIRSGAKFFQAATSVALGVVDRFGLGDAELALACASHGGEPVHVDVARGMAARAGLRIDQLACGAHPPMHAPSAQELRQAGSEPDPLHNNCSGKHLAMLMGALVLGAPTEGYESPDHPLQQRIRADLAEFAGLSGEAIGVEVDGCSAPTFVLPLSAAARAFARFGRPEGRVRPELAVAARRLVGAIRARPDLIAGRDRFCTALIEATGGRVLAKVGAEGFYGALLPERDLGLAVHVDDGSMAAAARVLAAVLERHGLLDGTERDRLERFLGEIRRNHAGRVVGRFRSRVGGERVG